jgi:hypothetical protein
MDAAVIERLKQDLSDIEHRAASVRARLDALVPDDGRPPVGHETLPPDRARAHAVLQGIIDRCGGPVEYVHPRELRASMIAHGVDPSQNIGSRGILEMREE